MVVEVSHIEPGDLSERRAAPEGHSRTQVEQTPFRKGPRDAHLHMLFVMKLSRLLRTPARYRVVKLFNDMSAIRPVTWVTT